MQYRAYSQYAVPSIFSICSTEHILNMQHRVYSQYAYIHMSSAPAAPSTPAQLTLQVLAGCHAQERAPAHRHAEPDVTAAGSGSRHTQRLPLSSQSLCMCMSVCIKRTHSIGREHILYQEVALGTPKGSHCPARACVCVCHSASREHIL